MRFGNVLARSQTYDAKSVNIESSFSKLLEIHNGLVFIDKSRHLMLLSPDREIINIYGNIYSKFSKNGK